jgi:hypothetical protein
MHRSAITRLSLFTAVLFAFVLSGCSSKESRWEGTYLNTQDHGKMELKGDHKGVLTMGGQTSDISWEVVSDEKIIVHFMMEIPMLKTSDGMTDPQGVTWKKQ